MRLPNYMYRLTLVSAASFAAGCGGGATPGAVGYPVANLQTVGMLSPAFKKPALIAFDYYSDALEYWPIAPNGGSQPQQLSASLGIANGYGLAANGNVVAIANYSPAEVVTYNVKTKVANLSGGSIRRSSRHCHRQEGQALRFESQQRCGF